MDLREIQVRPVLRAEEVRYQELMQAYHYLGALPKIGHTLWYAASYRGEWVALLGFSAAALKCGVRDRWIGWSKRSQYARLKLVANNSRYLILPDWHCANLGSKTLALTERRLADDWRAQFGHPLVLLETFVDPQRHPGSVYLADNWLCLGLSQGFRRTRTGYSATPAYSPKKVFVKPLRADCRQLLCAARLDVTHQIGDRPKMSLTASAMRALPDFFTAIDDPRRRQGQRHWLPSVLAIATAATLCGMRGYKAIGQWAESLSQSARERFRCRRENGHYLVPSESIIRDCLIRIDPDQLDRAFQRWNEVYGSHDQTLAIDGKVLRNAVDQAGEQTHVLSAVGHQSMACYAQKK